MKGLAELAHTRRKSGINKTRRLRHKHFLVKSSMKKSVINIKLSNGPATSKGKVEDNPYSGGFDHLTERLIEVNARALMEPFCHQMGLVPVNTSIKMTLDAKHPLAPN